MEFNCQIYGRCCIEPKFIFAGLSKEEVDKWRKYLSKVRSNVGTHYPDQFAFILPMRYADLIFLPATGAELLRCPFLRKDLSARGDGQPLSSDLVCEAS